ncbi:MAG: helix-turn-helix transcriptional regulator [Clostridiales bacterium]|nr:helix-turn-helix transcriptional regulator [Clostridiales bacterium]
MKNETEYLADTSVHYFVPKPEGREAFLYYPICVGYYDCRPNYRLQRNVSSGYMLIVMLTGTLEYQTRRSRGEAGAGQALFLDCSAPHFCAAQGGCSFTFIHFAGAQSRSLYEEIEAKGGNLIRMLSPNTMHESIGAMLFEMRNNRRMNEARTSALIYNMLMELLEASGAAGKGQRENHLVDQAIDFIHSHLMEPLTVEDIAASVGYSASYFSHMFTGEMGMSPYRFVVKSRVDQAQLLLKTTRLSVQEIAFRTGFNSAANFCYTFRQIAGVSPHEYRKGAI